MNLDPGLLAIIVCPDCRGQLAPTDDELVCQSCGLAYPVRDDIPVLLVDEARRPELRDAAMTSWFDEARLDDESVWQRADAPLRALAESGARVRREATEAADAIAEAVARAAEQQRPRAVVAAGPDSRLLRAVLEPWCPVPFVAWPNPSLPGWAGSLDLVVVLAPDGGVGSASAVAEAVRRGCQVVVACPPSSTVAEHAAGRWSTILPTPGRDQLATAVVMLEYLEQVQLGPRADAESVATALDEVAIACSPHRDLAVNPAKMLAIAMADTVPVVWGGTRAGRPCRPPDRRVAAPRERPQRAGRRRRAPAPRARGDPAAGRVRRPVRRRRRRPAPDAAGARRRQRGAGGPRGPGPAPGRRRVAAASGSRP